LNEAEKQILRAYYYYQTIQSPGRFFAAWDKTQVDEERSYV